MNKFAVTLLIAASLFISVGLNSKTAGRTASAAVNPTPTPTPLAEIERLELDKTEAFYICSCYGFVPRFPNGCGLDENGNPKRNNLFITVKPVVRNPKNTQIFYEYTATGGKILGQGSEVLWNLEGFRPGVYTITASIRGKNGVSAETKTESVRLIECDCLCPCLCPSTGIRARESVRASESFVLSAETSGGGLPFETTYKWTIPQGEITEGQGTSMIKVKTTKEMTGEIMATVEVSNPALCPECRPTASQTVMIVK